MTSPARISPRPAMLFACEFWHGASERALAQGFRALGRSVQEIGLRGHFFASPDLQLRLAQRLLAPYSRRSYNSEIFV